MKRMTSFLLSGALLLSLALPAAAVEPRGGGFSDTGAHYARNAIQTWTERGVLKGYEDGTFRPDGTITRAEMAAVLDRIMGYRETAENTWPDLRSDRWYADNILHLAAQGILGGDNSGKMNPESPITRQEAVSALARAFQLEGGDAAPGFGDDDSIASWARGYVSAMVQAGYVAGDTNGLFRPGDPISRAEVVTLFDRMVPGFVNADGTYSQDCGGNLVVNAGDVTLKDMAVAGDLIIADGVGDGDVYLDNLQINGSLIIRGGGEHSIHIFGDASKYGAIIITKTASGRVRLVSEKGVVIPMIHVADGRDGVTLEGITGAAVVVESDVDVTLGEGVKNVTVGVNAPGASLTLASGAALDQLDVAASARDCAVTVESGSKISSLTVAASARIDNSGAISKANVESDGVILDGKVPSSLSVSTGVAKPTDSSGKVISTGSSSGGSSSGGSSSGGSSSGGSSSGGSSSGGSSSGGSSSGGSSSGGSSSSGGGSDTPSPTTVSAVTVNLASPLAGKAATDPTAAGAGYIVAVTWTPALTDGRFARDTAYTAGITVSPATSGYVLAADIADHLTLNNSTAYGGTAVIDNAILADGKLTFDAVFDRTCASLAIVKTAETDPDTLPVFYQDQSQLALSAAAHVEADGTSPDNYPVTYSWYEKTEQGDTLVYTGGSYLLPSSLSLGSHIYYCLLTADGCEPVTTAEYTVEVQPAQEVWYTLSDPHLVREGNSLSLLFDVKGSTASPGWYHVDYYGTLGDGEEKLLTSFSVGGPYNCVEIQQELAYFISFYDSDATVTRLTIYPSDSSEKAIGNELELNCNITVHKDTALALKDGDVVFDPSTGVLTLTDAPFHENGVYYFTTRGYGHYLDVDTENRTLQLLLTSSEALQDIQKEDYRFHLEMSYLDSLSTESSTAVVYGNYDNTGISVVIAQSGND